MRELTVESGKRVIKESYFEADTMEVTEGDKDSVMEVLETNRLSMFNNSEVKEFESDFGSYVGTDHCVAFTNCTAALEVALRSVTEPGDEVVVPSYTYMATMMSVLAADCEPVLVDINPETMTIDVDALSETVTNATGAIVPVHLFGNPAEMDEIMEIARAIDARVVEDCSHGTGAKYDGRSVGSFDIGCHSFGYNKILRSGEGGAITTDDTDVKDSAETIRHEGEVWERKGTSTANEENLTLQDLTGGIDYVREGHNYRPSPILAALASSRLARLDETIEKMECNAANLSERLADVEWFDRQEATTEGRIYSSFIVKFDSPEFTRDEFLYLLGKEGVPVGVHFPVALHETTLWRNRSGDTQFPAAEEFCRRHIAFPVYPSMDREHIEKLAEVILDVVAVMKDRPKKLREQIEGEVETAVVEEFFSGHYFNFG